MYLNAWSKVELKHDIDGFAKIESLDSSYKEHERTKRPLGRNASMSATYVERLPIWSRWLNQVHYREPNLQHYIRAVNDVLWQQVRSYW